MTLKLVLETVECRDMPDCICESLLATSASSESFFLVADWGMGGEVRVGGKV